MEFSLQIIAVLFLVAIVAGWIDAVAGGGGLITVPALMLAGLPPAAAIATNKLQGTSGTCTAAFYFLRQGVVSIRENVAALLTVCVGSVAGGLLLTQTDTAYLSFLVPILLMLTALYFLFFSGDLDERRQPKIRASSFNVTMAPALGFYDGFFGPGTGSFMATALVTLRGFTIREATAHAKLFNFVSNISALVYFIFFGQIAWLLGTVMIGGQVLGAFLGARVALKVGARLIRPITIVMCIALSLSSLWRIIVN